MSEESRRLNQLEFQEKQASINKLIALTGSTLAIATFSNFLLSYKPAEATEREGIIAIITFLVLLPILIFILVESWRAMNQK